MSDEPADDLLELLARDLDGDLDPAGRLALFARLADRRDARDLLRSAVEFKRMSDTLALACDAAPAPDMAGYIIDAVTRDSQAAAAPVRKSGGLLGALRDAFAGREDGRTDGGAARRLGSMDLMGVVAGTGASPAEDAPPAPAEDAAPEDDASKDDTGRDGGA